ncbi:mevalonate kinase [Carboxylicivirga sp. M1479]|uniref:mevalonate kinase family protein n=1 Tax=Carboxylicivirga sp. M1479 TaxID=2594476 RepID=UPI001177D447|nr:mevalonate kinase [Carboxylicivirga sp. M1479]TRX71296.1 mevalonate kinase [Carboxylicivirga sp. M1479]
MQSEQKKEIYYSKVMLFGEYSIIMGSMGLTIPYSHFNGELRFINHNSYTNLNFAKHSNLQLKELFEYISILEKSNQLVADIDTSRLASDIEKGLYFESSIPEGYGLGSSGALVAALYHEYANKAIEASAGMSDDDLFQLKKAFAQIESFYHGTSSGIDPLICYLKHPIVLENAQHISSVSIPRRDILNEDAIFLVDAETTGKTGPLVKLFMDKTKDIKFKEKINTQLIPLTNQCIKSMLNGQLDMMFNNLIPLSRFQLKNFNEMIPQHIQSLWSEGLNNQLYTLKLCGSGGGGFFLGFTRNYTATKDFFAQRVKDIIPVYQEV